MWRELPESNKDVCRTRLLKWFEVDGWNTMRVKKLVNQVLQSSYRTWRNVLHTHYKKILKSNGNPRDGSPREEVNMTQWIGFCNYVETPDFKLDKSAANSASRRLLRYNHTSGKYRSLTRYRKMVKPEKIENWKNVHTNKNGQFANDAAATTWGVIQ